MSALWAEDGVAVKPEVRGLPDASAAIVNSREDWPQRKTTVGLWLCSLKQGS